MKYGPVPPARLPVQDAQKVMLLAARWQRASWAQQRWAERAKLAVDFFEGRQWSEEQIAKMRLQKRPHLKFNVIAPLVRLILGYHRNNRTDITFKPGQDSLSSESVAEVLTRIEKSIAQGCHLEYVDTEVFLDGLICGRGFFDTRLDWEDNDLGELKTTAHDPFMFFPDPDADTYDLNASAAYVQTSKYVSIDTIEGCLGPQIAGLLRPFVMGQTPLSPISSLAINDEIVPVRAFGEREDWTTPWWDQFYATIGDFVDTHRKTIRIIETQYKVREPRNVIIDLETGDKKVLPESWGRDKIEKTLLYCEMVGNPCVVQLRMVERIHWTTIAGDLILYDAPSFYNGFTTTGYFPYFRRGMTRGMVEDLIDPQLEKNKRRNAEIEIVSKNANGGWKYHENALDPDQERKLQKFGAMPGVNIKWKGEKEPVLIQAAQPPLSHERLERKADDDIRAISGINESALGELDRVQSGRAIEARQRQAVMSVQMYMDNFKRSKQLLGERHLDIIQNHYTEHRVYRILGEDGKFTQEFINRAGVDPLSGYKRIENDVTVGKYTCIVDEAPLSATFANAQFEEMLVLLEKMGPAIAPHIPMFADLIVDMSSLPRKQEWIERFKGLMAAAGMSGQPPAPGGAPAGGPPGGGLPAPAADTASVGGNVIPFNAATQPRG